MIELKAGTARHDAIGQVLGYMGDVADEESAEVRGILVAGEFDDKARAAARVVPGLSLRRYRVKAEFSPPGRHRISRNPLTRSLAFSNIGGALGRTDRRMPAASSGPVAYACAHPRQGASLRSAPAPRG